MLKSTITRIAMLAALLALFALVASPLMAQSNQDGAIGGTVTDQTNAVVAGAKITVRNLETNEKFTGESDSTGAYRIMHLRPGTYEVTIASGSFTPFKADRIIVEVGRVTSIEARMSVGASNESVQVTGEAPVINTVQPDMQNNINDQIINNTPIPIRRYSSFALSTPGAVPDGSFGLIAFRGISGLLNNSTVDGGDNNTAYWSEERGRTRATATVSQDSVREFQINTSNFSAEYGRAAGGVMNAVTKSGTNSFHGGGRLFATDSTMWAYNPFSIFNGAPLKPSDRRWVFGADIGGPIKKDKLFFFFNWDQQKENAPGVAVTPIGFNAPITVAMPASCSASGLNDGQVLACRGVSQATSDKGMAFLNGLTGQVSRNKDHWIIFPKVDWLINSKNTLTLSWNHMRWNSIHGIQTAATVFNGTNSWGDDFVDVDTGNARLVSLLTTKLTNEFRISIGRELQHENSNPPGPGEPTTGLNGRPPQISITGPGGSFAIGKPNFLERGALPLENRKQFADTMTAVVGTHTLKYGVDINHANDLISNLFTEGGAYSYSTRADFISDYAAFIGANPYKLCSGNTVACFNTFSQGLGPQSFQFSTNDISAFLQDEWHALPRLTVSLGLRWEYEQLPDPFWGNPNYAATTIKPKDKYDLGPRIGFAYDLTGDGKTVVRGGYGMYYGRVINAYIANELTGTGSPQSQLSTGTLRANSAALAAIGPFGILDPTKALPSTAAPSINVYGYMKNPRVHEVDVIVEREITRNTVVSVSYLMSAGHRLPEVYDRNLPTAAGTITYAFNGGPFAGTTQTMPLYAGARPNSAFSSIYSLEYVGKSHYDGEVIQINRRMTNGLQLSASYTHGRATDTNQATGTGATSMAVLDPYHPEYDNGTSTFDIRHRFNFSAVYQPKLKTSNAILSALVNGFTITPTFGISSGAPYTGSISGSAPCITSAGLISTSSSCGTSGLAGSLKPISSGLNGDNGAFRLYSTPRNSFRMPTTAGANLRVSRKFNILEGKNLELIAEAFNVSNHVNYTSVNTTFYTIASAVNGAQPTMNYNNSFGTLTQANNQDHANNVVRQFQFGARFEF